MSGWGISGADLVLMFWTSVVAGACSVACALVGCYLVLRRVSLLGDAISHAVLPGIAVAFLLTGRVNGWAIVVGAMAVGVLTAFLTQAIHQLGKVPEDASMGVVFTSLFAVGVLLISNLARHADLDPGCVLYGFIELVPLDTVPLFGLEVPRALQTMGPVLLLTLAFVLVFWKELKITAFDPALAAAMGINATLMHYLLMAVVAGVTVTSFEAVGSILVVAMLIVPPATAHLLTDRLSSMMLWSVLVAVLSSVAGAICGRVFNTSVAGMMAVASGLMFGAAVFFAPQHGILSKLLRNARLALRIVGEDIIALLYRVEEAGRTGESEVAKIGLLQTFAASRGVMQRLALWHLRRLGQLGFDESGQLALTAAGRAHAESLVRAHRLWEAYLERDLELPRDHLHEPAIRMEHFIDPSLQSELASLLGQPGLDPHGRSIPPVAPKES